MLSKAMVTGGWAMVTLSLGTLASGFPATVRTHWQWLVAATVAGVIVAIWGHFLKRSEHEPSVKQETHGDRASIGGSGKQSVTAGGDVSGDRVGDNNSGVQAQSLVNFGDSAIEKMFPKQSPPQKPPTIPNLIALPLQQKRARVHNLHWIESGGGVVLYVLPIRNEVRDQNANAISVCASLDLKSEPFSALVQKAFWLDREGHDIKIPVSHIEYIILGRYDQGVWFFYENLCQFSHAVADHPFGRPAAEKELEHRGFPLEHGDVNLEVKVFSRQGIPFITENFLIKRIDDRNVTVVRVQ